MANQTYRVLELIRRFNNNEKVCIEQLQNEPMWMGKSEKTIRRDLDIIKDVFPETFHLIRGEQGCYKAITNELFSKLANADDLTLLVQTFNIAQRSNLFDTLNIDKNDRRILERKIKETKDIYLFKTKPIENHSGEYEVFKRLERAIYHQKQLIIDYRVGKETKRYTIKPYRIVFMNENFYLAAEPVDQPFDYSNFRISNINSIAETNQSFHKKYDIVEFIGFMQTPFAQYSPNFKSKLIEVLVEVKSEKARFFIAKKFLDSQTIVEKREDGSLLLRYTVTAENEITDLILRWLPWLHVISPISLKETIENDLRDYLQQ